MLVAAAYLPVDPPCGRDVQTKEGDKPVETFRLGRYDYTLADIEDEAWNYVEHDEAEEVVEAITSFTAAEHQEMLDLAAQEIPEIDDQSGIDETTLLCRAALTVARRKLAAAAENG
jgi:hypothetical protein